MLGIISSLLSGLNWVLGLFSSRAQQRVGAEAQALRESNSATRAAQAEAQAEASAPRTDAGVESRLHDGSF